MTDKVFSFEKVPDNSFSFPLCIQFSGSQASPPFAMLLNSNRVLSESGGAVVRHSVS